MKKQHVQQVYFQTKQGRIKNSSRDSLLRKLSTPYVGAKTRIRNPAMVDLNYASEKFVLEKTLIREDLPPCAHDGADQVQSEMPRANRTNIQSHLPKVNNSGTLYAFIFGSKKE